MCAHTHPTHTQTNTTSMNTSSIPGNAGAYYIHYIVQIVNSFESVYNMYYMVNLPSYSIRIHLVDIVEAHCYVEYKVDLVNFENHNFMCNIHSRKQSMTIEQPSVHKLKFSLCTLDKGPQMSCNDP